MKDWIWIEFVVPMLLGIILGIMVGGMIGATAERGRWQQQVIQRGYAIYNPTNGNFQWKE